jgi:hypothetical protein
VSHPVDYIDPEALERVRAHVIASGLWPVQSSVLAIDAGDGRVEIRFAIEGPQVSSVIATDVRLERAPDGSGRLVPEDFPEPDFAAIVPAGVVRVVSIDHDLVVNVMLGPCPS